MLATSFLFKCFVYQNKEERHSRHYILSFTLLWVFLFIEDYSSMKDKLKHCMLSNLVLLQHFNSLIQMSNMCNQEPTLYAGFPL